MGVEINPFGKPIKYHILKTHPHDDFKSMETYSRDRYNIIPAEEIIHFYHQERPNQTRGVPPLSSCLKSLKMNFKFNAVTPKLTYRTHKFPNAIIARLLYLSIIK